MKKLFSLLTVLIITIMLVPTASLAESEAVFTIDDADNVEPGSEFTIVAHISGNYEVHGVNLTFYYDPEALEIVNCELSDFLNSCGGLCLLDYEELVTDGRIALGIIMPIDALSGDGDLISMTFRVKDGVTTNQEVTLYVAELSYLPVGTTTGTDVRYSVDNSVITIAGGTDPEDGFHETESGYPQGIITPDPNSSTTGTPNTTEPSSAPETTPTSKPRATKIPNSELSSSKPSETQDGNSGTINNPGNNSTQETPGDNSPIIYILIGVAVVAAIASVCLIVKNKKRTKKED